MNDAADDIFDIACEKIDKIEKPNLQQFGRGMLEQWMEGAHQNFCNDIFIPAVKELKKGERKEAKKIMREIKDAMADTMERNGRADLENRISANKMKNEILNAYELIEKLGRGLVFFGSARTEEGDEYYEATRELGREASLLLGSTIWTGAGPGQMEAPLFGAKEVGGKVGGIKIRLDQQESHFEQEINPALAEGECITCDYFGPRKIGLVDAAMRKKKSDHTAIIVTYGGFGTLDEFFEFVVLKQLEKIGSQFPVPIIVMSHIMEGEEKGFYDGLYEWLVEKCVANNTISAHQLGLFHVAHSNEEVLDILAEEYEIPEEERTYGQRLKSTRSQALQRSQEGRKLREKAQSANVVLL